MATYKPLQSIQLTTTTSSLTFSGIDQNYTDLVFVADYTKSENAALRIAVNGDTGANYSQTIMYGNGTTPLGQRETNVSYFYAMDYILSTSTVPNQTTIHFQNYSNTTTNKTFLDRSGNAANGTVLSGGLWRSTAAITSFTVTLSSGVFSAGSTFNLYGIDAGQPKANGGTTIVNTGTHWIHTFTSTDVFELQVPSLTVDYLVVAGGGGGGFNGGGGGGAGGYRSGTSLLMNTQSKYTVLVGAGGASPYAGEKGSNSSIHTISATGGGFGRQGGDSPAGNGGSGGGGGYSGYTPGTGGTGNEGGYSPVEGYNGGNGQTNGYGGGGGGSASAGQTGGSAGSGTSNSLSGSAITYAVGGSGGFGGSGGSAGGTGAVNRGNGGGGGANAANGGPGGSGIVIVKYPV